MTRFEGFPAGVRYTAIPSVFFARLLPEIDDLAELKVTLHVFYLLQRKCGQPRFVTRRELLGDRTLVTGLASLGDVPAALSRGLNAAVERGTLLCFACGDEESPEHAYMINGVKSQEALIRLQAGEITLPDGRAHAGEVEPSPGKRANIFTLYEENIGILSPLIVEHLKEAESAYPEEWVREAFREAVVRNKRSWHYVSRILERWALEGRQDGEPGRRSPVHEDPAKYIRGKYGRFVRH